MRKQTAQIIPLFPKADAPKYFINVGKVFYPAHKARVVKSELLPELTFFAHQERNRWAVSEASSGWSITSEHGSLKRAIARFHEVIKENHEVVYARLDEAYRKTGLAPGYQRSADKAEAR